MLRIENRKQAARVGSGVRQVFAVTSVCVCVCVLVVHFIHSNDDFIAINTIEEECRVWRNDVTRPHFL
jgi:hypothetical protein